jgi:anti-anti-sigma regulatory factor
MIYIAQQPEGSTTLHIHLEGTLDHEHVVALNDVVQEADERHMTELVLHCSGLLGIDDSGSAFLLDLAHRGAQLLDLPVTVSWKLYASDRHSQRKA